ncbi:hypothetical protein FTO74_08345 [Granulicella sp. WH15]|uniref:hypothetical protein n=1 Tax=Granulicella sp. WH15 TaxID=2602070 RepID=UPI00136772E1|nr:hypothetical protein [Granulicella sp. WH15]QHN03373.1 hypothetical protein FTO74_08345 [Granulicella sp. WH15]
MFGLFKPRATCEELSVFFAARFTAFLWPGISPGIDDELSLMVQFGADEDRIRSEIAAFCAFAYYRGMVKAFEDGSISKAQLDRLEEAFTHALEHKVRMVSPAHIPSLGYDTFSDWLLARLQRYTIVVASAIEPNEITSRLVRHFSDFACVGSPDEVLREKFRLTYEKTVANAAELIASHRLR